MLIEYMTGCNYIIATNDIEPLESSFGSIRIVNKSLIDGNLISSLIINWPSLRVQHCLQTYFRIRYISN